MPNDKTVTTRKKRCRKLTREEKKAVWNTKTEENAGVGWKAQGLERPPRYSEYERVNPKEVDKEFV